MSQAINERVTCPNCKKSRVIEFRFYSPSEGDEETEEIDCECGCVFKVTTEIKDIDIWTETSEPEIISLPNVPGIEEPYHSQDPNQLSLL